MNGASKLSYTHNLRKSDLEVLTERAEKYIVGKDALEIGSGTGHQLALLKSICNSAIGIDLKSGPYTNLRVADVCEYDGRNIPFPDESFDLVISSNVLEHIDELHNFHGEMKRVLKDDGIAIHILPSHSWRLWHTMAFYPAKTIKIFIRIFGGKELDADFGVGSNQADISRSDVLKPKQKKILYRVWLHLIPHRHGTRGNFITEMLYFRPAWWRRQFETNGWSLMDCFPTGIFHTGHQLLGNRISIEIRKSIATIIGSSTYTYIMKK